MLNKDYAKLGFIADQTGLRVSEVTAVLHHAARYDDLQKNRKAKESQEESLDIEKISKALAKHVKKEQRLFGPMA